MFCTHLGLPPRTSTTAPNTHFQVRSELESFRLDTPFPRATATLRMGHRHTKSLQDASFYPSQVSPWYLSPLLFGGYSCGKPHTDLLGKDNDGAVPHTLSQLHAPAADREGWQPQFWLQPRAQGVLQCGSWHLEAGEGESKPGQRFPGASRASRHGRGDTCSTWSREQRVRTGAWLSRARKLG